MIELTPEQRQAVEQGEPVRVIDLLTHGVYVLVRAEVYERLATISQQPAEEAAPEIPAQLRRSVQAFWRDLPELLKNKRNHGKWVIYHGDERIGIEREAKVLIRECIHRGVEEGEYHLDTIEPRPYPPWHVEEVEYGLAEFDELPPNP